MKNYLLKAGKKTLSVFLACLMLMTCWVFVTPEHNHAEAADSAVTYPVTLNFNLDNCAKGGNIIIHYYPVKADGTLDKSAPSQYKFMNSLSQYSSGSNQTYTAADSGDNRPAGDSGKSTGNIPGWPYKIVITTNGSWGKNANIAIKSIKIGSKTVLSTSSQWSCSNTSRTFETGGSYDGINADWPEPTWTVSSALGGAILQVPYHGTRTTGSLSASFKDAYGSWPQSKVNYSINGVGATLSSTTNSTTVSVTKAALANFTGGAASKDLTLTASLGTSTTINSTSTITLNNVITELLYENLFSLSKWYYSDSSKYSDNNVKTDVTNGTITITNPSSDASSEYTTTSSTGTYTDSRYAIPLTAGKTYIFECTTSKATATEVFFMYKKADNSAISFESRHFSGDGRHKVEFTAPANTGKAELRFDNNTDGTTAIFSNIAVYEKDRAEATDLIDTRGYYDNWYGGWPTRPYRKVYNYSATAAASASLDKPARVGHEFAGWATNTNADAANYAGGTLTEPTTLYAKWSPITYNIGYDNLFSFVEWDDTATLNHGTNGTLEIDADEGSIHLIDSSTAKDHDMYTNYGKGYFMMPADENTEYAFEFDLEGLEGDETAQFFIFYYKDTDGNGAYLPGSTSTYWRGWRPIKASDLDANGHYRSTFTTPGGCNYLGFRIGTFTEGTDITFKNITIYKKLDNAFQLSDWDDTLSVSGDGTIVADTNLSTITATQNSGGELYSTYGTGKYFMDVEPNTYYIFETNMTLGTSTKGQMFVFFYDENGNGVPGAIYNGNAQSNSHIGIYPTTSGKQQIVFMTPPNCTKLAIRVGSTAVGTVTYSDIGVYKQFEYEDNNFKNYKEVRLAYKYGDTKGLNFVPEREGWQFAGWYTKDGKQITDVTKLHENFTVYAHWTKKHIVTFWLNDTGSKTEVLDYGDDIVDGTAVPSGKFPTARPTKAPDSNYEYTWDGKWYVDGVEFTTSTKVYGDITVKPGFTRSAHNNIAYSEQTPATCTSNATVQTVCLTCGYDWGKSVFSGDLSKYPQFGAKGHDFTSDTVTVEAGSGTASQHKIVCGRVDCDGVNNTKMVDHTFENHPEYWTFIESSGAPCGEVINTYKCKCNYEIKRSEGGFEGHDWSEYVSNNDATCTSNGTETRYCKNGCGSTETREDDYSKLPHTWQQTATKEFKVDGGDANCMHGTIYYKECSDCDAVSTETWTDDNDKTEHSFVTYTYNNDAACGKNGTETAYCEYGCKTADTRESAEHPAKVHDFSGDYIINNDGTHSRDCVNVSDDGVTECNVTGIGTVEGAAETCIWGAWVDNNDGTHGHTCTLCGYTPKSQAHTFTEWVSTNPSNEDEGQHTRHCTVCDNTETVDCTYESVRTDETCEDDAYTTKTCNACKHQFKETHEGTAIGHTFTGEYRFNANTDYHNRECINGCGKYGIGVKVDASGVNKWEACSWTYSNDAADGVHTATCVCGNTQDEECSGGLATCTDKATCEKCFKEYGDTVPHSFSGAVVTFNDEDKHAYLCVFCGDTTGIYGIGETENDKETCFGGFATCATLATCDVCGKEHGELNADEHKYGEAVHVDGELKHKYVCEYDNSHVEYEDCVAGTKEEVVPDCEAGGYIKNTCEQCGHKWDSDEVVAPGHKYGEWVSNNDGTHTRTCIRPGCAYGENGAAASESASCTVSKSVVIKPTCTERGYTKNTCECGYEWIDENSYVDPTGHSFNFGRRAVSATYLRTEQSCTQDLTYWYRCDYCNESAETARDEVNNPYDQGLFWVSKTASNHKFTKKNATAEYLKEEATCTTRAVYYYSCANCGETSRVANGKTFLYGSVLGHAWAEVEDAKYLKTPADCVNDAVYFKVCSRCDIIGSGTWTKENSKAGHDFDHDNDGEAAEEGDGSYTARVEATCTTAGNVAYYTCQVCNKKYEDTSAAKEITNTVIKAFDHKWESVAYLEATCEEDGYTPHKECSVCHTKDSNYHVYPATGHNFSGDYVYHNNGYHSQLCVNGNCDASGIGNVKYSVTTEGETTTIVGAVACTFTSDYTHVVEDDKHYHSQACVCGNAQKTECTEKATVVTAPTCTEDGYTTHECEVCGETWKTDIITASGHDTTATATPNNDGKTHSVKCSKCDYRTDAENCYGGTATCKDKATCEVCGQKYGETGKHTLAEDGWKSNNDATCTVDGTESQTCSVCQEVQTRIEKGSALGHNMTDFGYDVSGWTNGSAEVKATIKAPTCAAEGKAISYCTRCDHYITKTVAKLKDAHVWNTDADGNEIWEYVSGDCSTFITYKCVCTAEGCGYAKTKDEAAEHEWTKVITTIVATCTNNGKKIVACKNCGSQKTEILKATEHNFVEWTTHKDATCCEAEVEISTCTVCKTTKTRTGDVPATGIHDSTNLVKWHAEPATCESDGYIEHYRSSCGKYFLSSDKGKTFTQTEWSKIVRGGTGHADNDGDGKCDSCKTTLQPGTTTSDSCICHKTNWFMKTIYSILKLFWKIFGINETCVCGAAHY